MNIRRIPLTLLALACLLGAGSAAAQDIRLQGLQGEHLAEGDMAKGTIIVVFWTSWSPHSRDIVARVNPLARRWSGKARVVTVNFQEERPAVESFLAGKGLTVSVFLDGDGAFAKKYSMATLPGLLIVRDGQTLYKGRLPDDPDRVISEYLG
ncbi:MAG TPA: TlpA disulfide reductase family protein [Thermoanaerobaculia bacterium]|jgi:thiol-disulfide isomerase/thioredoxin|nr:TlpA disulfide reductase family protein [Thermoanaerobaculia bacterium]